MNLIFIITYSIWFLSEIIINRLLGSKKTDMQNADKGSLKIVWIIVFIAIFTAVLVSNNYPAPIMNDTDMKYFGIFLIYAGIIFRLAIIKSLGNFFTVDVTIKENHRLKKDGFYTHLRHPSYTASLISFIGFGISLNNLFSLIIIFVLILSAFAVRIKVEEKTLTDHFGSEYLDYKKVTKGIIPFIY